MVRATEAEVKKLFLGTYPAGVNVTNVGNILAGVDYLLDGYVKKYFKVALSTTDTDVVHIANLLGKQVVLHGLWASAGGSQSDKEEPVIFTMEIIMLIEAVISDTTSDGAKSIRLQESS